MDTLSADTLASRGPISGESPLPTDSRINTVLPKVEWVGEVPHLVSNNRDRFEELGVLGVGGMGEVVLARDHDIGRTVALKRMLPGKDMATVLRFVDEVRAVGSLEHPNIVPVHDVGIDSAGRFFFVMKRLDGQTLETVITSLRDGAQSARDKLTFPMRAQIFLGILAAVAYAHKQGFIHRDLKPANIMLGPFGEVTVMDWGLAKQIRGPKSKGLPQPGMVDEHRSGPRRPSVLSTQLGSMMGTPLYMSPEQARGEHDKVDERSDIYSLTVLFHELCFGTHYLAGRNTLAEVVEGVKTISPRVGPKLAVDDSVPAELQWYMTHGFEKKAEDRFQSVDEMIAVLQQVLDGRFEVKCARTMAKRGLLMLTHGLDRKPWAFVPGVLFGTGVGVIAVGKLMFDLISAL